MISWSRVYLQSCVNLKLSAQTGHNCYKDNQTAPMGQYLSKYVSYILTFGQVTSFLRNSDSLPQTLNEVREIKVV